MSCSDRGGTRLRAKAYFAIDCRSEHHEGFAQLSGEVARHGTQGVGVRRIDDRHQNLQAVIDGAGRVEEGVRLTGSRGGLRLPKCFVCFDRERFKRARAGFRRDFNRVEAELHQRGIHMLDFFKLLGFGVRFQGGLFLEVVFGGFAAERFNPAYARRNRPFGFYFETTDIAGIANVGAAA